MKIQIRTARRASVQNNHPTIFLRFSPVEISWQSSKSTHTMVKVTRPGGMHHTISKLISRIRQVMPDSLEESKE